MWEIPLAAAILKRKQNNFNTRCNRKIDNLITASLYEFRKNFFRSLLIQEQKHREYRDRIVFLVGYNGIKSHAVLPGK